MPKLFDPGSVRAAFMEFGLQRELARDKARFMPSAVGNAATNGVGTIISAWLVGLHKEIRPALMAYREWLEDSIARDERFGSAPDYAASRRNLAYGLCIWMLDGENHEAAFLNAMKDTEAAWDSGWRDDQPATAADKLDSIDDFLGMCLQSRQYQRGALACSEHDFDIDCAGHDPQSIREIATFGCWLCSEYSSSRGRHADLPAIANECLEANLQSKWLGHGQYIRAAMWLKIVYWDSGLLTDPLAAILRAYNHMPLVRRPSYVDAP